MNLVEMPDQGASRQLIDELKEVIEEAKAGKVTNFVLLLTLTEGQVGSHHYWDNTRSSVTELLGELAYVQKQLLELLED